MSIGFAVLCLIGATGLRYAVAQFRPDSPFNLYLTAVIFASVLGGTRVGATTLGIGGLLGFVVTFPSTPERPAELALAGIYLAIGALIIWGIAHYRSILLLQHAFAERLLQEENYRNLIVNELEHRLKNKSSIILALVHQTLHNDPAAAAKLDGRIRALSATDDLIGKANNKGCDIRDLLLSELEPYGKIRFALKGEACYLPAKLAVSLALMFHELATNAVKHGAFSCPSGALTISWQVESGFLNLIWLEQGPAIGPVNQAGFGTKLLKYALLPYQGKADIKFLPTGLQCNLRCKVVVDQVSDHRIAVPSIPIRPAAG